MAREPQRPIVRPTSSQGSGVAGLHLGAEYNDGHGSAGPPMDELVSAMLADGSYATSRYFKFLISQVRCFGDPGRFRYDDVSQVRATGKHSAPDTYRANVASSVTAIAELIEEINPALILVAGTRAFVEFEAQVLPRLRWCGNLIRVRNPSAQAHRVRRGLSAELWLHRYAEFRTDLLAKPRPHRLIRWHLISPDAETPFRLLEL